MEANGGKKSDIPCIVLSGDGEESISTTFETLVRILTVQAYIESHGRNEAVRQTITVWKEQWQLTPEQVSALLVVISQSP